MKAEDFWKDNYPFIWNDGWWLENEEAWFVAGAMDGLFHMDMNTMEATLIDVTSLDRVFGFRQHPRCFKKGNRIFCFPDLSQDIFCYHIEDGLWTSMDVKNPNGVRISCTNVWCIQDKLYVVSVGLKQVLELNLLAEKIEKYHDLPVSGEERIAGSILVGDSIYIAGAEAACVYKFHCCDGEIKIYPLHQISDQLCTIVFDGDKFWLGGHQKKIYIWKEDEMEIFSLEDFPEEFGVWNFNGKHRQVLNLNEDYFEMPTFLFSAVVGQYVWFFPAQTNEILYIDKDTFEIKVFAVAEEEHTEEELARQLLRHKYLFEYIRDERYLGLYSLKNKWIIEIDGYGLQYKILDCKLNERSVERIEQYLLNDYLKELETHWSKVGIILEQEDFRVGMLIKMLCQINTRDTKEIGKRQ